MQAGVKRSQPPARDQVLRQRVTALARALNGARAGDVSAIHKARVATRRLREALPLLREGAGRKSERMVRRLTRALGPVRELDVALQTLEEFAQEDGVSRPALSALRRTLAAERLLRHREAVEAIDRSDLARLRRRVRNNSPDGQARAPLAVTAPAIDRVSRRAVRLRAIIGRAASMYIPERLHAVRIAVKKLRYALEVARQVGGGRPARARATRPAQTAIPRQLATLKQAQELLGRMHDLEMLIARIRLVQGAPQAPSLRVSGELDRLVRALETECRVLHGRYIALRPQLLAVCDGLARAPAARASSRKRRGAR